MELNVKQYNEITIEELLDAIQYWLWYEYSVYFSDLFQAIADYDSIVDFCADIENKFGTGIANSSTMINEAIENYIKDMYGDNTKGFFDIYED